MITFLAVQDNIRTGLLSQYFFPGIEGEFQFSIMEPGKQAAPLSTEPSEEVRDNAFRIWYTLKPDLMNPDSGVVFLKGMKYSLPGLVPGTGELHRHNDILSGLGE